MYGLELLVSGLKNSQLLYVAFMLTYNFRLIWLECRHKDKRNGGLLED